MTPFHLMYRGEAVVPVDIGMTYTWINAYREDNDEKHMMELDLVDESQEKVAVHPKAHK